MATLTGIDVSSNQATTPPLGTLAFLIARAGFGSGNGPDSMYATHAANARAAGKALGAYWFWYDGQDNAVAVADFLAIAGDADFLALDLEGANAATAAGLASARDFLARVHAAGRKIGLYHSLSGFPSLGQDWTWVAYWESTAPPIPWTFWQYGGSSGIDHDKFAGDAAALAAFLASQGAAMSVYSTNATPAYVDIPGGETLFDADGKTVLGKTVQQLNTFSPGVPKGAPALRLYWRSFQAGVWQLVAAAPNGAPRPVPTGVDLDAARQAGYAEAKAKAASAVQAI